MKYSREVFNYFYEVALHSEMDDNKIFSIKKWKEDIHVFIEGDTISGDRSRVLNVIKELNALNLPITLRETFQNDQANVFVTFESNEKPSIDKMEGNAIIYAAKGVIYKAEIKISSPAKMGESKVRNHLIFEEITQCLGLPGDSYAYPESLFYQDVNFVQKLSELDKQLLHLLYEPEIAINYSLDQYKKDFGDILYTINGKQKFLSFLNEQQISEEAISNIYKYGLSKDPKDEDEKVSKYNYPTHVIVKGDFLPEFIDVLNKAIKEINAVSTNLKLILIHQDSVVHNGGIHFNFIKDSQMKQDSAYWESKHLVGLLLPRNSKNEIIFKYREHDKLLENVRKAIPNLLYKSVCLTKADEIAFYDYDSNAFQLKPLFRETLRVYYDNALPPGFTKKELEEVMSIYND